MTIRFLLLFLTLPGWAPGLRAQLITWSKPATFSGNMVVSNAPAATGNATLVETANSKGQTVTLSGQTTLEAVIFQLDDNASSPDVGGDLQLQVYALDGAYPSGNPLFSSSALLPEGLVQGDLLRADFSPALLLTAGAYALTLSSDDLTIRFNITPGDAYGGGELIRKNSSTGDNWASSGTAGVDFIFGLVGSTQARPPPGSGPNLLIVLADDFGWTDLSTGAPNRDNGSGYYETPNLDRLAREGLAFTSCYVQPNCAPSRAALLSGQYAPRSGNGVYNVTSLNRGNGTPPLKGPAQNEDVPVAATTLAEALQAGGYVTAHFGKYHVGGHEGGATTLPLNAGFDYNFGGNHKGNPGSYWASEGNPDEWTFHDNVGPELDAWADPYDAAYLAARGMTNTLDGTSKYLTDAMGDALEQFLSDHSTGSESNYPFYVQFHTYAVHTPVQSRQDLIDYYNTKAADAGHDNATYAGMVSALDEQVGRLLDRLDDPNGDGNPVDSIASNTVVLFCSDNGGYMGPTDNRPLRGSKGMFYEGGIRVPLIVRQPGSIPTNRVSETLVHAVDFYPTLLELAGLSAPDPAIHRLDGISFATQLAEPATPRPRAPICYHFPGYLDTRAEPCSVIIEEINGKRYKMLYTYEDGERELYNLSDDISETTNLLSGDYWHARVHEPVSAQLASNLTAWLEQDDPDWNPSYPTVRATDELLSAPAGSVPPVSAPPGQGFEIKQSEVDRPPGQVMLEWNATEAYTFSIESSTNLLDWVPLRPGLPGEAGSMSRSFEELGLNSDINRYYRITVKP